MSDELRDQLVRGVGFALLTLAALFSFAIAFPLAADGGRSFAAGWAVGVVVANVALGLLAGLFVMYVIDSSTGTRPSWTDLNPETLIIAGATSLFLAFTTSPIVGTSQSSASAQSAGADDCERVIFTFNQLEASGFRSMKPGQVDRFLRHTGFPNPSYADETLIYFNPKEKSVVAAVQLGSSDERHQRLSDEFEVGASYFGVTPRETEISGQQALEATFKQDGGSKSVFARLGCYSVMVDAVDPSVADDRAALVIEEISEL